MPDAACLAAKFANIAYLPYILLLKFSLLCRAMHNTEVPSTAEDQHMAYLAEVAALAMAAAVRLTSHKGKHEAPSQKI